MKLVPIYAASLLLVTFPAFAQTGGWSVQSSPTTNNLYGVAFSDGNTWVAVGDAGAIIRSTDGGVDWTSITDPAGEQLRAVAFRANIGIAVGFAGRVLRSTDAGVSWSQLSRPTTRSLYAVSIADSFAVITGEEGTILVSIDGGQTWSPRTAGTASILFGVSLNAGAAVGVGGHGAVVMSTDLGKGFGLTVLGNGGLIFFYGTSFASVTTGWAVGSSAATGSIIIKSVQSGFVWTLQTAPTTNTLTGVSFRSLDTGTAVGFSGTILRTTNGGTDWLAQESNTTQSLNAVSFVDPQTGVAVGDNGTICRTVNGGLTSVGIQAPGFLPSSVSLYQNYPNPFNPSTTISYEMPKSSVVRLSVYDIRGREVAVLVNGEAAAGFHSIAFDGTRLSSGVYFYRLQTGSFVGTKRLVLLK